MIKKKLFLLAACISFSISTIGQEYFYYSNGKQPLILIEDKMVVSIPVGSELISKRICENVQILSEDAYNYKLEKIFDVIVISQSELERLTTMEFWKEDAKSVILTNVFFYPPTRAELELYPSFVVELKNAEDEDLLTFYIEKHKLKNLGMYSKQLPLCYKLLLTPESENSSLDIANEMHESGKFEWAIPDFLGRGPVHDNIRGVISKAKEESQELFDLQGRRLQGEPRKGVYVSGGRKYVVR